MAPETSTAVDQTEIFQQLEAYPWDKDAEFQGGLSAILGPSPTTKDPTQLTELTLRAQCFYLSRKRNIPIDFEGYKNYLSSNTHSNMNSHTNSYPPSGLSQTSTSTETAPASSSPPPPPPHNPNASDLPNHEVSITSSEPAKTAPYPSSFSEIVALITSGAPIPGIRDIPDTLLTDHATKPVASKRRKPWEKDAPDMSVSGQSVGTFGDERDVVILQELPEGL